MTANYDLVQCTGIHWSPKSQLNPSTSTSTRVVISIPGAELVIGFALLDRLYLRNGTFFIVTETQSAFPPRRNLIAPGMDMGAGHDTEPTDKVLIHKLRFIDPAGAEKTLGPNAIRIDGFSVVVYDTEQFMRHLYHWWGEIVLGSWRDLAKLDRTVVFDRAIIVSRETSGRHPLSSKWFKMISSTMSITPAPEFFEPLRRTVIANLLGYLPLLNTRGAVSGLAPSHAETVVPSNDIKSDVPVVTYISRQGGARRLSDADHEGLVQSLRDLESEGICRVNVVRMETMSVKEQVAVASRSTVLIGVHGNGLTHEIWMPPSSRSTVIEIFTPNGYLFDYEILAQNLGHKHYAVWDDTLITFPKGTYHEVLSIPAHGPSVVRIIRKRVVEDGLFWRG
ncbi:hypothetical protein L208DRAFT_1425748 [Tricholoma matsutake]|nr:hypothetical protein L208DRAFT_1425748 [Tricholoma matsutake 945]